MAKKDVNNDKKNSNFSKELRTEMKKVTWPTFKELVNSTTAVISIVLIVAAIVFILDVCFKNVNQFGIEELKATVSSGTDEEEDETTDDSDSGEQIVIDDVDEEDTDNSSENIEQE